MTRLPVSDVERVAVWGLVERLMVGSSGLYDGMTLAELRTQVDSFLERLRGTGGDS